MAVDPLVIKSPNEMEDLRGKSAINNVFSIAMFDDTGGYPIRRPRDSLGLMKTWLVVEPTPLKNMKVSLDEIIAIKRKKQPPTSIYL